MTQTLRVLSGAGSDDYNFKAPGNHSDIDGRRRVQRKLDGAEVARHQLDVLSVGTDRMPCISHFGRVHW